MSGGAFRFVTAEPTDEQHLVTITGPFLPTDNYAVLTALSQQDTRAT
jgi:hypothetical protein